MSHPDAAPAAPLHQQHQQQQQHVQHAGPIVPPSSYPQQRQQQQQQQPVYPAGQNSQENRHPSNPASQQAYHRPQINSNGPVPNSNLQFNNGPGEPVIKSVPPHLGSSINSPVGPPPTSRTPLNNGSTLPSRSTPSGPPLLATTTTTASVPQPNRLPLGNGPTGSFGSELQTTNSGLASFAGGLPNSRPPHLPPTCAAARQQTSAPVMYSQSSVSQQATGPLSRGPPVYTTAAPSVKSPVGSGPSLSNSVSQNLASPTLAAIPGQLPPRQQQLQLQQQNARPPLNSGAPPPMNNGPALNSIPAMQRPDPSQGLTHQFHNISLAQPAAGPTAQPPYGYSRPETQQQQQQQQHVAGSQAYSTMNRPLDMRSPGAYPPTNMANAAAAPPQPPLYGANNQFSVTKQGFNKIWGMDSVDVLQCRHVLPGERVEPPRIKLHQDLLDRVNCSPDIFRCTLTKIPESNSLLQKARLPLGILIHPFKDLNHLPVIQCNTIVRCRSCRTYINPFVYFVDSKRWKCNLCYKVNELPDEFQFDPATKSYGDPSRRPEIRTSTIEFIAPSEYMLRPPQPAVYLFIFDVSRLAVESGYLSLVCGIIAEEMARLPGDGRTQVGVLAVNSAVHFFGMPENVSQPQQMIMTDVEDVFLPCPENLLVNLKEREELLKNLLLQLPVLFKETHDTNCALGAALQAAYKLMSPTGGRVTVFQTCLPNVGPGALQPREDPNARAGKDVPYLNPATDFYKRLALDCSGQQVAVDLFLLNCQYSDLATLSGVCKFSGGCMYNVPLFQASKLAHAELLERMLRRYLSRKIGFEAVMRIRCTRGLGIHTFHGNFFVRSTDLLSLPNVNPDAGFGMQVTIDENLSDAANVCFQAALLYTSSRGERRIRVHTLCLPTTSNLADVLHSADQQCIVGLLAKMAVDRSVSSSLSDAREALINAAVDALSAYKLLQSCPGAGLLAPHSLKLLPMYIIALLKSRAFRFGVSTRLDDRFYAMCQLKTLPLSQLIQLIYPDLYAVHDYVQQPITEMDDGQLMPMPDRLHLSAEKLDSRGAFLLDHCDQILLYVGKNVHPSFCYNVLGVPSFAAIPEEMWGLPELASPESERLRTFVAKLQDEKPYCATIQIIRDDGHFRTQFTERLIEDRFENALSYYEFLQHIKTQVK